MSTNPFHEWVDLSQPRLGTKAIYASDDFFAPKERILDPKEPIFIPDKYDENGKWMDGWESRRRRAPGHDYCIIRLGVPGRIRGVDIDTRHFTGNYPPFASIDACHTQDDTPNDSAWETLLDRVELGPDAHHFHSISVKEQVSHVRLNIFPDGGVARLRLYGEVMPDWSIYEPQSSIDLFALQNGGRALLCTDEHFGSMHNLNLPGRGINMGDGWETARRRGPGHDWVILRLGHAGVVERLEVDTAHFKGNYPDRVSVEGLQLPEADSGSPRELIDHSGWRVLLPETKLKMDQQHFFSDELLDPGPFNYCRMNIFPDGGISRLRIFGTVSD